MNDTTRTAHAREKIRKLREGAPLLMNGAFLDALRNKVNAQIKDQSAQGNLEKKIDLYATHYRAEYNTKRDLLANECTDFSKLVNCYMSAEEYMQKGDVLNAKIYRDAFFEAAIKLRLQYNKSEPEIYQQIGAKVTEFRELIMLEIEALEQRAAKGKGAELIPSMVNQYLQEKEGVQTLKLDFKRALNRLISTLGLDPGEKDDPINEIIKTYVYDTSGHMSRLPVDMPSEQRAFAYSVHVETFQQLLKKLQSAGLPKEEAEVIAKAVNTYALNTAFNISLRIDQRQDCLVTAAKAISVEIDMIDKMPDSDNESQTDPDRGPQPGL